MVSQGSNGVGAVCQQLSVVVVYLETDLDYISYNQQFDYFLLSVHISHLSLGIFGKSVTQMHFQDISHLKSEVAVAYWFSVRRSTCRFDPSHLCTVFAKPFLRSGNHGKIILYQYTDPGC